MQTHSLAALALAMALAMAMAVHQIAYGIAPQQLGSWIELNEARGESADSPVEPTQWSVLNASSLSARGSW